MSRNPADAGRCQWTLPHDQCRNRAENGSQYCHVHGGAFEAEEEQRRLYHLTQVRDRQRLSQLSDRDQVQSLREVIATARRLVEKRWNLIQTDADFVAAIGQIDMLQLIVARITKSALTIEASLDALLSKSTVLSLGRLILEIVKNELQTSPQIVARISSRTIELIATASNTKTATSSLSRSVRQALLNSSSPLFEIDSEEDLARILQLSKHEKLKTLNEDIALSVMLIERLWNLMKSSTDLIRCVPQLASLLKTLEKQIKASHEAEQTLGELLNIDTVRRIGSQISLILSEEMSAIPDREDVVDRIMLSISASLSKQYNSDTSACLPQLASPLGDSIPEPTPYEDEDEDDFDD